MTSRAEKDARKAAAIAKRVAVEQEYDRLAFLMKDDHQKEFLEGIENFNTSSLRTSSYGFASLLVPLMICERNGIAVDDNVYKALISKMAADGFDFIDNPPGRDTSLAVAIAFSRPNVVRMLIPHTNLDHRDKNGNTPLMIAESEGEAECADVIRAHLLAKDERRELEDLLGVPPSRDRR